MPIKDGKIHHVAPEGPSAIDRVWSCRLSGRDQLSYADAQESELNLRKVLQLDFAAEWEKIVLHRIHHSRLDIGRLAQRCIQTLEESRIKIGETVWYEPKKGKSHRCTVIQVLENTPKKNEKENSTARYDLVRTDDHVEVSGVPRSKLVRSIPMPSLELMKIFIRAHSQNFKNELDMPWVVEEPYLSMHKIEPKLDMEQVWRAKKEGKLILPAAPPENKKRKRAENLKEPKSKKAKTDQKDKKTPKEKKTPKQKQSKQQTSIFDHFQKGISKTKPSENGTTEITYAQKLLDMIDVAKQLESERHSSDEYWDYVGKVGTTTCMWSVGQREELFEKTTCSQLLREDIFGRIQIKKLTQSSRGTKFRLKGMRPLPSFSPIETVFDEDFSKIHHDSPIQHSVTLSLCDFVLQFDLSDIRDRLHGLSEDKMTGYHYHKYASKFVIDLLNGCEKASTLFWTELYLGHFYAKKLDKETNKFTKSSRSKIYNGFALNSTLISQLPQQCMPFLAGWHHCTTPLERADLLMETIESCLDYSELEEMFSDWRTTPLGTDRHGRLYWMFYFSSFVFIQDVENEKWSCLTNMEDFCKLVSRLDERHIAEYPLKKELLDQREEIHNQFENFDSLSTEVIIAPPVRRTRQQVTNSEIPKLSIRESLVLDVKRIADRLWMGMIADIDDGDVLQSMIDSTTNESLSSLREIMIQIINSVPNENLSDHMWNGKEKHVYIEKFNQAEHPAEYCIFWAIFDRKVQWSKEKKRKIEKISLPSRASTRRRVPVKYTYNDSSQDSYPADSSDDDQIIDDAELMKQLSRQPTRTSARIRNQT